MSDIVGLDQIPISLPHMTLDQAYIPYTPLCPTSYPIPASPTRVTHSLETSPDCQTLFSILRFEHWDLPERRWGNGRRHRSCFGIL